MYCILIFGYLTQILARDCSLLPGDYMKIVAKNSEIIIQPTTSIFSQIKSGDDLKLEDQGGKLSLIPPLQLTSTADFILQPPLTTFTSFSVSVNFKYDWLNKFQLLGKRADDSQVLMSTKLNKPGTQVRNPQFDTFHMLNPSTRTTYYSSAIIDQTHLIIDSSQEDEGVQQNFFYLIDETTSEKTKIPNDYPFTKEQRLQIQSTGKYLYRGTTGSDSRIDIYSYDLAAKTITLAKTIDENFMKPYIVSNITDYKFEMVDFKVGRKDELAILDKTGNIFYVSYSEEKEAYFFKWDAYLLGDSISFDYDFKNFWYAVVQKNAMKSYFQYYYKTYETTDDLTLSKAHLAKDNFFLTSSTKIVIFQYKYTEPLIYNGDFSLTLHDYTQNDFVTIGVNIIKHYRLNDAYQIYYQNPTQTSGTGTLTLNGCYVTIDYQNVEKDSVQLIKVSKAPLIDTPLFSGLQQIKPLHQVDGPKQTIKFQQANGGIVDSLIYNGDITITDDTFKMTDITYVQTVSYYISRDQPFQIVMQNKDLQVFIYTCKQIPEWNCTKDMDLKVAVQLTKTNSLISNIFNVLKIAVLVSPTQFIVYEIQYAGVYYERRYAIKAELEVDSFYQSGSKVVFYSSTKKTLIVHFLDLMQELYTITPEDMAKLGITWNPKKLFSNDLDELFYILNGDQQALILNLDSQQFSVAYIMDNLQISKDYLFMNFYQRFALVQLFDNGFVQFNVYNKKDQTNIYLEKQPSFYLYKITDLKDFFYVSYNGVVNVKAHSDSLGQDVVLTYLIDQTDHNSLHTFTIIGSTYKYLTCTQYNVLFFEQNALYSLYIQTAPTIDYKVSFNDNTFVQDVKFKVFYSNEMILVDDQTFRLANTYLDVKINSNKLIVEYNLTSNEQDHKKQDLGNDWYSGEVSQFELTFPQIHNEVTIINPIELVEQNYSKNTKNIADINDDYIFILKNDTFFVKNKKSNKEENPTSFQNFLCEDIIGQSSGQLLVQCNVEGEVQINGVNCVGNQCKFGLTWMKLKSEIIRTYIDGDILFLIYRQKVEVYKVDFQSLGTATLLGYEDFKDLGDYYYGITAQRIYPNHYHIYCTDPKGFFFILDYKIENNKLVRNPNQSFDLLAFINKDFYTLQYAYHSYISIINIQQADRTFKADYIVSPTKGPHYGIHMEFTCPDDVCQLLSKKIAFVLQGYGNYELLGYLFPLIQIKDSYVIIPYVDPARIRLIMTVYNLPKTQSLQSAVLFFGAIKPPYYYYRNDVLYQCYFDGQQPYLLTNAENSDTISKYKLNASPQLMMNGQISTQLGVLKIKNDYSSDSVVIKINAPNPDPSDTINGSSHTAIWVVLGIIGGGLVIGAGIYCYKKKQTKVDTLI